MNKGSEQTHAGDNAVADSNMQAGSGHLPRWIVVIVLIVALVAMAAATVSLLRIHEIEGQTQAVLRSAGELADQIHSLEQVVTELKADASSLDEGLNVLSQRQDGIGTLVERLRRSTSANTLDWALAEIEYLLIIASHRLELEHDVRTALAAMQAADRRLAGLSVPGLLAVRRQLKSDMNDLQGVVDVDVPGLSLYMADLVSRADSLPLAQLHISEPAPDNVAAAGPDPNLPWWRNLLRGVWGEIKQLLIVRRNDDASAPLLLPDQQYFLRENLGLQLQTAMLAVLRRDTQTFRFSVERIIDWLRTFFDVSDPQVSNVIDSLQKMRNLELHPPLPDIDSSLESVRAYMRADRASPAERGSETHEP